MERVENLSRGKTDEQITALKYFLLRGDGGWLNKAKLVSDQEFDDLVEKALNVNNSRQKALDKIGIDESEVNEVEPVNFWGNKYDDGFFKKGNDGKYRASKIQITRIFFSSTQIYIYQDNFNLTESVTSIRTEEYFYKDITNFSTLTETVTIKILGNNETFESHQFAIVVPGNKFMCALPPWGDSYEKVIQGMKAKLREKKQTT
ncbi:MAG: hypothetical protein FWF53_10160 [Candidatus Azobacteroides sp.]|nr:hypothetical protein [Candidatus Azobacteroides sp.]